jgi:AraC-like DNA-binding protein
MGRICAKCMATYGGKPGSGGCLAHVGGLDLFEARCGVDRRSYSGPAFGATYRIVLVRSGAFLATVDGRESFVDSTVGLLTYPGDELRVAHPLGSGDTFTAIEMDRRLASQWPRRETPLHVDDALDLRHRALVAACRRGVDDLTALDQVHALLDRLLATGGDRKGRTRRAATVGAHRRLVDGARQALRAGGYALGLEQLAALVGCSPHHLSRVFRQVTGETLTAHRNRLRVRAVLADLQDEATNLRTLAATYGFADQAHLIRVVRGQLGQPPGALRRWLTKRA